ncbi:Peptidyl-prolyl cis-trans isomerase CYP59 [Bienertia sinuspersici]
MSVMDWRRLLFNKFLYGDQARFFKDEINPDLNHSKTGTVAMASAGKNLNASQFYITLRDDLGYLDEKHTVFGQVVEEEKNDDDDDVRLEDNWVPMEERFAPDELEEVIRAKEAHSRAVVLESIGDIPDANTKPPENVLFVCNLNSLTEDEDLHTIFSRFGSIRLAKIVRDGKTGDSKGYAFIEFESKKACEQAYAAMDGTLIDDRRICVDFSQSAHQQWLQYRRKRTRTIDSLSNPKMQALKRTKPVN